MKNKTTLLWLLCRIRRRIPALLALTAAHAGQALLGVCFALGTRQVIDCAVAGRQDLFLDACMKQGAIILGILLCTTVLRHLRDRLTADLDRDWKRDLLHGLLHGDYAAVSAYHSAELLNRMNNDVRTVNEGLLTLLPNVTAMVTRLLAAVAVLAALDGRFTILMILLGSLTILVTGLLRRRMKELHKRVSEHDGRVSAFLQESMEKLLMVQAMDVSAQMENRADALLEQRYEVQRKRKNVSLAANTGVSLMSYGAGFLALCWCAWKLLRGEMSFGSLSAVTQLVGQLKTPFVGLSGTLPKYFAMLASADRLMELEAIEGEPAPASESAESLYGRMDALCARDLCFSYDRDPVFEHASFSLPKGSFAAVAGQSGIGKSTLLKLLLGIFRPERGGMFISCGGEEVSLDRSTRRLFAYVPQGNLLLSGSLLENLLIVKPQATPEEIQQAVYVGAMEEFLHQLPQGLDTVMGENGAGLSEGQAQRLAISRAVLSGAPILLLDECTSALDAQTEARVLRRLRSLPDRTCIAVTHRPAALELCDLRLILRDGKIQMEKS